MENNEGKIWVLRFKDAKSAQSNWLELWRDCRRYTMPQDTGELESATNTRIEGRKRTAPVNATAIDLCAKMASGLHSATVSYGDRWFLIKPTAATDEWARWGDTATRNCIHEMQQSNFLAVSADWIHYYCAYGTGIMFIADDNGTPRYRNIPINNNVCIETDAYGDASTVYVGYHYTSRQAVQAFGFKNVSDEVRRDYEASIKTGLTQGRRFTFVHITYPKALFGEKVAAKKIEDSDAARLENLKEKYRPYGGIVVEENTGHVVKREGFHEFPYAIPFYMLANGESYGRSIPMLAMDAIKSLNEAMYLMMDASHMSVRPPLAVPTNLPKLDLNPGQITRVNGASLAQIWAFPTSSNIPVGDNLILRLTEELRSLFKEDFFMAVSKRGEMSATEVAERVRQASEFISPAVMSLQRHGFRPIVMRTLAILERAGKIPPRPRGGGVDVAFVSRIDSMIRQAEASRDMQYAQQIASVGQLVTANPDIKHVVKLDALYDELADAMGINHNLLNSAYERAQSRQAEAQAQAEQQKQMMELEALKRTDLTKDVGSKSLLSQMGMGGA